MARRPFDPGSHRKARRPALSDERSGCIVNGRNGHSYLRASVTFSSGANRARAMPDGRFLEPPPKMYCGEDAVPALVERLRGNGDDLDIELIID